jgi:hypothetical protein
VDREQSHERHHRVSRRPIISLFIGLAFVTAILLVTMFTSSKNTKTSKYNRKILEQKEKAQVLEDYDSNMLAVVRDIESEVRKITLFDIKRKETLCLFYTGASDITDKYGQVITAGQIPVGAIVDAGYQKKSEKLIKLQVSQKAWDYVNVSNQSMDDHVKTMKLGAGKYQYTDEITVIDGDELVPVTNLAEQDMLTVRGVDKTIWSITITKGHGTVILEDYDDFMGGNITVGYEPVMQITEDMKITVREGKCKLTVDNNRYSAIKYINVLRNQETMVSLAGLGPDMGMITFEIEPFGADLLIDGEATSYANPIRIPYGEHKIKVSMGGYTTYMGTLNINEAAKTIKIDLPEAVSYGKAGISTAGDKKGTGETEQDDGKRTMDSEDTQAKNIDEKHHIFIQNPIGASIYINGKFMGISPAGFSKVIGNHVLTLIKEGYETKSYNIEVLDDGLDTYYSLSDLIKSK